MNTKKANHFVLLAVAMTFALVAGPSGRAVADIISVSLPSVADTDINGYSPTVNHGTWGAIIAGNSGPGANVVNRDLIRFDLSSIPTNAIVLSATLRLAFTGNNTAMSTTLSLYQLNSSWTESGVTWNTRDGSTAWSTPGLAAGVDYDATPSSSLTSMFLGSNTARSDFSFTGLVADVQAWVNNPSANYGWFMVNSNEVNNRSSSPYPDKQWFTKEFVGSSSPPLSTSGDATPYLDIEYIPEPSSVGLLAVGGWLLWRRRLHKA